MGKHSNGANEDDPGVHTGAFELGRQTIDLVQQVVDDLWTVTGFCATDEDAAQAMDNVVQYLHSLIGDGKEADSELVAFGIQEWLHEVCVTTDEEDPREHVFEGNTVAEGT